MHTTTRMHRSQALMWCCWFVMLLVLPWVYGVSLARLKGSAGHPPLSTPLRVSVSTAVRQG